MSRLVKCTKNEPTPVTVGDETVYICACGLTAAPPFCDGSHEMTADETPGKLCWYDKHGFRNDVAEAFPDIREP
ncbi:MAG TPA: iron-binding protein [Betaproteobacteria bacterium]|nr:iron-binding protein [Betaproteobacteria bacterium]